MNTNVKFVVPLAVLSSLLVGVAPSFALCTVPNQLVNGEVADATQVAANVSALADCAGSLSPAGSANAIQFNGGSGVFAGAPPLTDGQLLIGSTGNSPQAGTLTAGSGIAVVNTPGGITIAATGSGGGGGVDWLNQAAVVQPNLADFTLRTSTTPPADVALAATSRGILLSSSTVANNTALMAEASAPSGHWQATMLAVYSGPLSNFIAPAIAVRDATSNRAVEFGIGGGGTAYRFDYIATAGGIGLDSYASDTAVQDAGLPYPSEPLWTRLTYDGTNFIWSFSRDGEHFIPVSSVSATSWLTSLDGVGPAIVNFQPAQPSWPSFYHILSWSLVTL